MILYLEDYLGAIEHLPIELKRNFNLIRDLDARVESVMKKIDRRSNLYLSHINSLSFEDKKFQLTQIANLLNKAREYGDDRVQLAIDSYDLVDKHICRMDLDLEVIAATRPDLDKTAKPPKKAKRKYKKRVVRTSDDDDDSDFGSRKKKQKKRTGAKGRARNSSAAHGVSSLTGIDQSNDIFDMPVDPNEPTYCICHQVSYGEMIGCDNPNCPIEWFHFPCVGLTTKPMGEWYCPKCAFLRKAKSIKQWFCPRCAAQRK